jgi:hypothetical protein
LAIDRRGGGGGEGREVHTKIDKRWK